MNKIITNVFILLLILVFSIQAETTMQEDSELSNQKIIELSNASKLGDANAMFELGELYLYGDGVTEDSNIAAEWYLKAAQAGHAGAMYELGDLYTLGWGVVVDINEAEKWYSEAMKLYIKEAETGDSNAMFKLGEIYDLGLGVSEDVNMALDWYQRASLAGNSGAMYKLGDKYYFGEGVEQSYTKSKEWFLKASESGDTDAMYEIGLMYENGKGVKKDYEQAKIWYKKAIELGDNKSEMRITVIFLKKYYKIVLLGVLLILVIGGFVYGHEKKTIVEDAEIFEISEESMKWPLGRTVRRYIGALFIYMFYKPTFVGAMAITFTRDSDGKGWGNHYILSLIAVIIATFFAALLTGATAKKKGGFVASIANIPNILLNIIWLYFIHKNIFVVESVRGWNISIILAIIGSVGLAYWGGRVGEKAQKHEFDNNTILGIRPFHWSWLWFAAFIYLSCIFYVALRWFIIQNTTDLNLISVIPALLALIPVLAYGYPMILMYEILCGKMFYEKHAVIKASAFIGIYFGGLALGFGVDFICSKILGFIF